ncbi:MAG: hypothetical protein M3412_07255 [Chloroflexota bacterium]|nr:hypothetical protein [Chloroflexota bacterium]
MADRPKPFSSEWITAPPPAPTAPHLFSDRVRAIITRIARPLPGDRTLSVWMLLILVIGSLLMAGPPGQAHLNELAAIDQNATPAPVIDWGEQEAASDAASISTDSLAVTDDEASVAPIISTPPDLQLDLGQAPEQPALTPDGLLPEYRILTYYGFPGNENMGILGEHDMQRVLELLRAQAAEYEAADPSRPVMIAFEVIASVAQPEPQTDGSFLLDTPSELLDQYAEFTAANDILLFLDVQVGRRTVEAEIEGIRPWLELPHVHLAIDPEFAMEEGQIPGDHIGQVDATDIAFAQRWLVDLTTEMGIPPKVLIVHQFHYTMIENKDQVEPMAGVQLVIDADGFGPPATKTEAYAVMIGQMPIEYHGVKLFYKQDVPLMTAEEILDLEPVPDLVIYQ